ncbi:MAG: AbrB/MazE/SpoVT family DNA-binding domain-containing protein [Candidatus Aenigmarchaeota archaeon]|nr:AbrB/MazE/SpoVT family DNA-binding domain-containing protein [Candidatus Aenigmarchaeota archaeon]
MATATAAGSSTITAQGQVTIPKGLRKRLGMENGDIIQFLVTDKGVLIIRKVEVKQELEL